MLRLPKIPALVSPAEQVEKIIASKNANAGLFNKRQLVFGLFDQRIHGIPDPAWGEDGKPPLAEEMAKLVTPTPSSSRILTRLQAPW